MTAQIIPFPVHRIRRVVITDVEFEKTLQAIRESVNDMAKKIRGGK